MIESMLVPSVREPESTGSSLVPKGPRSWKDWLLASPKSQVPTVSGAEMTRVLACPKRTRTRKYSVLACPEGSQKLKRRSPRQSKSQVPTLSWAEMTVTGGTGTLRTLFFLNLIYPCTYRTYYLAGVVQQWGSRFRAVPLSSGLTLSAVNIPCHDFVSHSCGISLATTSSRIRADPALWRDLHTCTLHVVTTWYPSTYRPAVLLTINTSYQKLPLKKKKSIIKYRCVQGKVS